MIDHNAMPDKTLCISRLRSGGLITNYHCSSACRHCLYRCSPRWPKDYITPGQSRNNLETIRNCGCYSVHIGGGEPLLNPGCVASVLEAASEVGIAVEYVETNSSWFRTLNDACEILNRLADQGLSTLLVSISPFHNEHIPFYKVAGVLEACRLTGISVFPWIAAFIPEVSLFDDRLPHSLEDYTDYFGEDYVKELPCRYWISPGGRALETFRKFSRGKTISELTAESRGGCAELAEVDHFHIDLCGNYVPGLCAGVSIRKEDLGSPLDPEAYPIISRLYSNGIGGFLAYVTSLYDFKPSKTEYWLKCELCYEIRRFLVVDKDVESWELQPAGHYLYG